LVNALVGSEFACSGFAAAWDADRPGDVLGRVLFDVKEAEAWRKLRQEHDRVIRAELSRFGGREIKTMGDGFLVTFDGPARAVYSARSIAQVLPLGLEVGAGLHTGEIELDGDDAASVPTCLRRQRGVLRFWSEAGSAA
jgi:class 3 adenylate cyclase